MKCLTGAKGNFNSHYIVVIKGSRQLNQSNYFSVIRYNAKVITELLALFRKPGAIRGSVQIQKSSV